jgi:hypothetical protein
MIPLVAVDVATRLARIGLATGFWDGAVLHVTGAVPGAALGPKDAPVEVAAACVGAFVADHLPATGPGVLGLDAPLGWPAALVDGLRDHRAGEELASPADPHLLWRRHTDREIHARTGKMPLEVGADRIARAAAAALAMLACARSRSGHRLPVPVTGPPWPAAVALEVYPAATARVWLGRPRGPSRDAAATLDALAATVTLPPVARSAALADEHVFDAILALLACADAAAGYAFAPPSNLAAVAEREGWIWVRDPGTTKLPG